MIAAIVTAVIALALLVGVFLGVRALYLKSRRPVSLAFLALYLFTTLLIVVYFLATDPDVSPWRLSAVQIDWFRFAIGVGVTASALIVLDHLLLKGLLVERRGLYLPGPLRLAIHGAVVVVIGLILLRTVLNINIVALVAVPTVLTAVIGFALKDTLTRLFEGIALGRLMHIGDWVSLVGIEGRVVDISLGRVTLQTRAGDHVTVPNNIVAQKEIVNYSKPTREHLCCVDIEASFADSPTRVIETCRRAAAAVSGVLSPPQAFVAAYRDSGIEYRVCFMIDDFGERYRIESDVRSYLWHAFRREGIEIPLPVRELRQPAAAVQTEAERRALVRARLAAVDFLAGFSPEELDRLAAAARERVYLPGEAVVREGEAGSEFFCIVRGAATVSVAADGQPREVATLTEGQYFGEMSLLTGEPRAASVTAATELQVLVIGKPIMQQLLAANPALVERLAQPLAARLTALQQARAVAHEAGAAVPAPAKLGLAERIRRFLGRT
jgi:small-conductance mechanosensitive channel/CRP-like cAMP-binding protein